MNLWYRIDRWKETISTVDVIKETPQFVTIKDRYFTQPQRRSKGGEFFKTFDEAKAYLVEQCERELQRADDQRSRAIQRLKNARAVTATLENA